LFFLMKFFDRFRKDKERKEAAQSGQAPAVETPSSPPAAEVPAPAPVAAPVVPAPVAPAVEAKAPAAEAKAPAPETPATEARKPGLFARLKAGLRRTSSSFNEGMGNLFLGRKEIDDELLEELETQLLLADVGIDATQTIVGNLTRRVSRKELADAQALYRALQEELKALLLPGSTPLVIDTAKKPYVILMVGVNGVGKTTTIGKLAKRFSAEGKSVLLAAGDTFRAAAVEQLQVWGERNGVPVIAQHTGADSASVLFDALQAAQARQVDVLIADTAGRLHNKDHLMEELKKVVRVLKKLDPTAPHEVMLVLDAGTGQNALAQARHFQSAVGVTGITLTKLDGTAKGGIIFAVSRQCGLPIRFIGVGEQAEDLRPFEAEEFVRALFQQETSADKGQPTSQESPAP
jgi:fused signal recognition particle receptor